MGKVDRRLLGLWKSDRRRTFRRWEPPTGADPKSVRTLKSIFGRLTIRYGRRKFYTDYDGHKETVEYELMGSDSQSVVIRAFDSVREEFRLTQIHFDGSHYWIWVPGFEGLREFFKRVDPTE